jgi:hypothetical protein
MDGSQTPPDPRTLPELVSQLTMDLATLVRKESELVRTEMTEKLKTFGKAAGEIAAGGILVLAGLLVLLQAVVAGLAPWLGPAFASLLVGLVVLGVAAFLIMAGIKMLKAENLTPDRTARQLQKDAQLMKGR